MAETQVLSRSKRERRSADIRDWAALNWDDELAPRGRIPDAVVTAYYEAQGIPTGPPPPEPDDTSDVSRETSQEAPDVSRETSADDEPVAPDPAPSRPRGRGRRRTGKTSTRRKQAPPLVTDAVRKEIAAKLAFLAMPVLMMAEVRDPHCGGALADQKDELLDWAVDLICDSPDALEWFTRADSYGRWFKLAGILSPVANVIVRHHVTHTITDDEPGGGDDDNPYAAGYTAVPAGLYVAADAV